MNIHDFTVCNPLVDVNASNGSDTDDIDFSKNGAVGFAYTPSSDPGGCDENVTDFRVIRNGALSSGGNFTLRVRYIIK